MLHTTIARRAIMNASPATCAWRVQQVVHTLPRPPASTSHWLCCVLTHLVLHSLRAIRDVAALIPTAICACWPLPRASPRLLLHLWVLTCLRCVRRCWRGHTKLVTRPLAITTATGTCRNFHIQAGVSVEPVLPIKVATSPGERSDGPISILRWMYRCP